MPFWHGRRLFDKAPGAQDASWPSRAPTTTISCGSRAPATARPCGTSRRCSVADEPALRVRDAHARLPPARGCSRDARNISARARSPGLLFDLGSLSCRPARRPADRSEARSTGSRIPVCGWRWTPPRAASIIAGRSGSGWLRRGGHGVHLLVRRAARPGPCRSPAATTGRMRPPSPSIIADPPRRLSDGRAAGRADQVRPGPPDPPAASSERSPRAHGLRQGPRRHDHGHPGAGVHRRPRGALEHNVGPRPRGAGQGRRRRR